MSKRKSYAIVTGSKSGDYAKIPAKKIAAFNSRITTAMKLANREFQKKQKVSAEKASNIVLNA